MLRTAHLGLWPPFALLGTLAAMQRRRPDYALDRWADDGGPISEARDTPTSLVERMTRQQRRWRQRHGCA